MKKNKYLQVRISEEEMKKLEEICADMCMNKSQYVMYLINLSYKKYKRSK